MKICQVCNQTYSDDGLNFCLNDGGVLMPLASDDAPPTIAFKEVRKTQENWTNYQTGNAWQSQPLQQQQQSFYPAMIQGQNQTLPTIALVLGILSLATGCCYGGIPLGLGAIITGYLGLKNTNENSQQYGGRSLAIGGIITGGIGLLISVGIILIAIIANIK